MSDLWIEIIDSFYSTLQLPTLHGFSNIGSISDGVQIEPRRGSRLPLKNLRRLYIALYVDS